jgi:hypothetical protein
MPHKLQAINRWLSVAVVGAALVLLPGCSIRVKDNNGDGSKKVDISTPVGGLHVDESADVRDTGLPVYPGARRKAPSNDGEGKSANVNLSTFGFGLKVVALEYESDDPPDKLLAYYQDKLKKYGNVLQCHTSSSSFTVDDDVPVVGGKKGYVVGGKLKCGDDDSGTRVELKSGTSDNQHLVSVRPQGKGSDFAIVWVRMRGKEDEI